MFELSWDQSYFGNTLGDYAYALGYTVGATLVGILLLRLLSSRLKGQAEHGRLPLYLMWHAVQATRSSLIFCLAALVALFSLQMPEGVYAWLYTAFIILLLIQVLYWGNRALVAWSARYQRESLAEMGSQITTVTMFIFLGRLVFFAIIFLLIVDAFPGVEITALVAGLGIGGIAIALALQNILSDIFASLTITLDKPFVLGDFIKVGEMLGSVEHIGLKTTRLRSLSGEQLVFANNDLLTSRIQNFKRMFERRVPYEITVTYDTPPEKIRMIPEKIKEIIQALPDTRFDRAHFKAHGDHALVFEIVYYVLGPDFNLFMDRQQAINLATHEFFLEQGIEFAFPTQTLYLKQDDPAIEQALQAVAPPSGSPGDAGRN